MKTQFKLLARTLVRVAPQVADAAPPLRFSWRRALALSLCALASFALTAALLHQLRPPLLGGRDYSAKLAYYAEHRDEFDVVFIGSSRVYRQIMCREFDAQLAAAGCPLRSFNLGQSSMKAYEADVAVRRVLALGGRRLKYVVVEVESCYTAVPDENRFTARVIAEHDAWSTLCRVRDAWLTCEKPSHAWSHTRVVLAHCAANVLNIGRQLEYMRHDLDGQRMRGWVRNQGYEVSDHDLRPMTTAEIQDYAARLKSACRPRRPAEPAWRAQHARLFSEQAGRILAAGVTPLYIITPGVHAIPQTEWLHAAVPGAVLCDYRQPVRYPDFYRLEHRRDSQHLNAQGSRRFTQTIGADFLAWLAAQPKAEARSAAASARTPASVVR